MKKLFLTFFIVFFSGVSFADTKVVNKKGNSIRDEGTTSEVWNVGNGQDSNKSFCANQPGTVDPCVVFNKEDSKWYFLVTAQDVADMASGTLPPANAQTLSIASAVSAGGAASEALTFTGFDPTTDTVLGISQQTPGANSTATIGWSTPLANTLTVIWTADPGAGAVVNLMVIRK